MHSITRNRATPKVSFHRSKVRHSTVQTHYKSTNNFFYSWRFHWGRQKCLLRLLVFCFRIKQSDVLIWIPQQNGWFSLSYLRLRETTSWALHLEKSWNSEGDFPPAQSWTHYKYHLHLLIIPSILEGSIKDDTSVFYACLCSVFESNKVML